MSSWRLLPSRAPLATTEISPGTPDTSQLSPVISLSIGLLNNVFSLVPPQRRSLRIGLNFIGYIFIKVVN